MKKSSMFSLLCTAMMFSPTLLLAEGEGGVPPQQGLIQTVVMIGIAILFFYVILWRPEQKRRKALEEQRSNLKKGDRVTAMGIIGTVDKVDNDSVVLRMIDGNKIEMLSAAITEVMAPKEESKSENE
ncbi:MAG: preprotein translocase subunit YajC [Chlamydiota bacterium]